MFAASLPDLDSLDLEAAKALLIAQHESYTATLSSRSTEIERLVRNKIDAMSAEEVYAALSQPAVGRSA